MSAHTPGPWRVDGDGIRALVRGADATIVAVRHRLPHDTHVANARLIAAAPEMLRVLRAVETVFMIVEPRSHKADYLAALDDIRSTIATATGAS